VKYKVPDDARYIFSMLHEAVRPGGEICDERSERPRQKLISAKIYSDT
jgi:hypothetical protein